MDPDTGWVYPLALMMRHALSLLLLSQSGCDVVRSIKGTWMGTCTFQAGRVEDADTDVTFGLDIHSDDGTVIQGDGAFEFKGLRFEGVLSGDRFDQEVTLTLDGAHGGEIVRLEIMGERVDEQIDGSCLIYGIRGDLSMIRRVTEP